MLRGSSFECFAEAMPYLSGEFQDLKTINLQFSLQAVSFLLQKISCYQLNCTFNNENAPLRVICLLIFPQSQILYCPAGLRYFCVPLSCVGRNYESLEVSLVFVIAVGILH